MKKNFHLGVFSGKGGVGKTTITASIAVLLARKGHKIIAVDSDVDAPNLSILFRSNDHIEESFYVKTTEKATVLPEKCIHCQRCIIEEFCHFNAISWDSINEIPQINELACEGCRACELLCPAHAFKVEAINSGTISKLESKYNFPIISGETILGAQTSGKLVSEMKKYVEEKAEQLDTDLIILDGPPGIGCPVIAAAADLDYIIIVIEPTTAALHDAQRFIEVISHFGTPFGIILNKADIWLEGAALIREFVKRNNISLLAEIPLDNKWPVSVAKCIPYVIYQPNSEITTIFMEIVEQLEKIQLNPD